ncbi:Fe-S protein assembly co-chaperone HscB [Nitrogeniibacter mangrovi]|uniref:Co-chaperone protein HscB homolog n=1 Tax=Nitrogeniibacter mangrovi TaxID=2016596 RepID=A0A6C1B324_9RHOO|nr:Fe-S protein assembly co-chaperone HscB [Nitrogeniibacter mangrovi]QID18051.1 Fe-S protein assembly co-chaperone HscB [Nitrogeniibacter mangrovi]
MRELAEGARSLQQDYFALFDLPRRFAVDTDRLEQAYLDRQGQVHPDRHAHRSDAEKRVAMQWATRINEAYRTLRKPLARARYLLELQGFDVGVETNTVMAPEFLMEQMEWREAVEEARDGADLTELEHLHRRLVAHAREVNARLGVQLDGEPADLDGASDTVRRLMFIEKLQEEIDDAIEALED